MWVSTSVMFLKNIFCWTQRSEKWSLVILLPQSQVFCQRQYARTMCSLDGLLRGMPCRLWGHVLHIATNSDTDITARHSYWLTLYISGFTLFYKTVKQESDSSQEMSKQESPRSRWWGLQKAQALVWGWIWALFALPDIWIHADFLYFFPSNFIPSS